MRALVVYDSMYGNTEKLAQTMAKSLGAKAVKAGETNPSDLKALELLVVGSPTHGGWPSPAIKEFLDKIPTGSLKNVKVAVFDTRFLDKDQRFTLQILMKVIGYAAPRIAKVLESKGGRLVGTGAFIVNKKEGPVKEGEIQRAASWAREIINK